MLIDTAMFVGACYLTYELVNKIDPGSIIASKFKKKSNYCLTLGHTKGVFKRDIVVDFRITPHLLPTGGGFEWAREEPLRRISCSFQGECNDIKCVLR